MKAILEMCKEMGISRVTFYKLTHKFGRYPTKEEVEQHKKTAKAGRPRKYKG